jgi:hypothetical protein
MPTMLDVAKRAGVALSTVSYAINDTRPISEETRRRDDIPPLTTADAPANDVTSHGQRKERQ